MNKILSKILEFFKDLFKPVEKVAEVIPIKKPEPPVVIKPTPNVETLNDQLITLCSKDLGQREPNGKNRSKMIDEINNAAGVDLGSPYCLSGIMYRGVFTLCKNKQLKMPIHIEASTQEFWRSVPSKYKRLAGSTAKKGDICIMQSRNNPSTGHAYLCIEDEVKGKPQKTLEYNTDPNTGDRDGDGVYIRTRSQDGDLAKRYLGCVDICQWIRDLNNYKEEIVTPIVTQPNTELSPYKPLSWEAGHPERKAWSEHLMKLIGLYYDKLILAKDLEKIYPGFMKLSKSQQINVFAEFICWVCYYECAWNPLSNSVDVGNDGDLDTYSVGLMQMSVVDQVNYKLKFGYDFKDLQDPLKNLDLALAIMAYLSVKKGLIMIPKGQGTYWATISPSGRYDKSAEIIGKLKNFKV